MGGLAALRLLQRSRFRVLMFHEFQDSDRTNLDRMCEYITRHFEPVPLRAVSAAITGLGRLPPNALAVTVDDGYKNFLLFGHPIFARYRIPTTLYVVSGFADGRLWLWPDQIAYVIERAPRASIGVELREKELLELDLSSAASKEQAARNLIEALKTLPNERRLKCLEELSRACGVEIPPLPPAGRAALNWEELRTLAADGVEIGCHTDSHPILSRITDPEELDREIRGAKEVMEQRLKRTVEHFCYPNGRDADISDAAVECVRQAGFVSSVTCTYGLNTLPADPLRIMRLPFDADMNFEYAAEVLAGLHLRSIAQST